ncbi:HNH endonuclease family protein [Acinetobacter sp. c1-l78]|uniref:HNH endonuclease family protein n=1 Tax=Acinetobacter sp. c1-l78 TaxID=3342803 RepID=UPI0035BABE01
MDIINANGFSLENKDKVKEKSERFHSVIDFSNFLMHVLRIYLEKKYESKDDIRNISLDTKFLMDSFEKLLKSGANDIKEFGIILLQCRYLFDRYVIKTDQSKERDDHWSLLTIKPSKSTSYQYNNSFDDEYYQNNVVMLLSMFHVSHPAQIYKNWLYAVMRWLFKKGNHFDATAYIDFLEKLSDRYYFNYYCSSREPETFFNILYEDHLELNKALNTAFLDTGTNVPNFIFNRLDYLLWKNKVAKYDKFRFTFRSSVEHFYPQNPDKENIEQDIDKATLDHFGNLCLVSSSINSKFSNNMPKAKKANFANTAYFSLKLDEMMSLADSWAKEKIIEHGDKMKDILNTTSNSPFNP